MSKNMKQLIFIILTFSFSIVGSACTQNQEEVMSSKKEISSKQLIKLLAKGKDVLLVDKIILDDLDFVEVGEGTEELKNVYTHYIYSSIVFKNCQFKGKVITHRLGKKILHRSFFMKNLSFIQCVFEDEVAIQQSTVQGITNFSESVFNKKVSLETSVFQSNVFFDKVTCQNEARFQNALFQQDFSSIESFFYQLVSFQRTTFKGNTTCSSVEFHHNVDFGLTVFDGPFLFNYNKLKLKSNFNKINCRGKFECLNTTFEKEATFKEAIFLQKVKWANNKNTQLDFSETIFLQNSIGDLKIDSTQTIQILIKK